MRIADYQVSINNVYNVQADRFHQIALQTYRQMQNLLEAKNTNLVRDQTVVAVNTVIPENKFLESSRITKETLSKEKKSQEEVTGIKNIYYAPKGVMKRSDLQEKGTFIDVTV